MLILFHLPSYDASQDWKLTGANEKEAVLFERKLDACDLNDRAFKFVSYKGIHTSCTFIIIIYSV